MIGVLIATAVARKDIANFECRKERYQWILESHTDTQGAKMKKHNLHAQCYNYTCGATHIFHCKAMSHTFLKGERPKLPCLDRPQDRCRQYVFTRKLGTPTIDSGSKGAMSSKPAGTSNSNKNSRTYQKTTPMNYGNITELHVPLKSTSVACIMSLLVIMAGHYRLLNVKSITSQHIKAVCKCPWVLRRPGAHPQGA